LRIGKVSIHNKIVTQKTEKKEKCELDKFFTNVHLKAHMDWNSG